MEYGTRYRIEVLCMAYNIQPLRTQKEIDDFLACLDKTNNPDRNKFLLLFGINTGLRVSDIVVLKVGQINNTVKPIIKEQKTGKKKRLYLSSIQDLIHNYCDQKQDSDWLFPSRQGGHISVNDVYKMFRKVRQQLGRDDIGTHTMRKTYGYWFYKSTHDLATLQLLFNHSSENITKRYIGVTEDDMENSLKGFKIGY